MKHIIDSAAALASTLKTRRKELGITQKELADFCDLSHDAKIPGRISKLIKDRAKSLELQGLPL